MWQEATYPHPWLLGAEFSEVTNVGVGKSFVMKVGDRILSNTPGAEPPRDAKDSGSARSHSTHLETSSSNRP